MKPTPDPDQAETPPRSRAKRLIPLAIIVLVALAGAVFLRDTLSFDTLARYRSDLIAYRDAHYAATMLAYVAAYVAIVAFSLPGGAVATMTGGFLFALWPGAGLTTLAATAGATIIFLAARWGLGAALARRMEAGQGRIAAMKAAIDANQWSALFLIRLVPAVPFFVANLLPALVNVSLLRYVVSTFFGIIPGVIVFTSVGAGLGEVFAAGERPDLGVIFEWHILGPLLGLIALAALPIVLKPLRRRKGI